DDTPATVRPTAEHLAALRERIRHDINTAAPDTVRALLQAMTMKIEVASRASITPTFRIPASGSRTTPDGVPEMAGDDARFTRCLDRCPREGTIRMGPGANCGTSNGVAWVRQWA